VAKFASVLFGYARSAAFERKKERARNENRPTAAQRNDKKIPHCGIVVRVIHVKSSSVEAQGCSVPLHPQYTQYSLSRLL